MGSRFRKNIKPTSDINKGSPKTSGSKSGCSKWLIICIIIFLIGGAFPSEKKDETTTESMAEATTEASTGETTEITTEQTTELTTELTSESTTEPASELTTEPANESMTEPASESAIEQTTEPMTVEATESTTVSTTESVSTTEYVEMVWIPKSGSKYHRKSTCSNMSNPTQISREDAVARGYTPCKKCY